MPYGRIDVYWPDGPIESYQQQTDHAIGRSTGNDIVLDTTAISRYHITLTVKINAFSSKTCNPSTARMSMASASRRTIRTLCAAAKSDRRHPAGLSLQRT